VVAEQFLRFAYLEEAWAAAASRFGDLRVSRLSPSGFEAEFWS
jgi:hypothetical protein